MVSLPDPDDIARDLVLAIQHWNDTTERGRQTAERRLGVSDIGTCREYVRRMTVDEEFSDSPDKYKAFVGSALDRLIVEAVGLTFPNVLTNQRVVVKLPSGSTYPGHPDLVLSDGVIDVKTVDGLTKVKRQGPDLQQQFQRHLYAAGLVQAGTLPEDCWVGNAWFDRSGRDSTPHVQIESYDPTWLFHADEWLDDVFYAIKTGEEAQKDPPVEWCAKCCEFFSECRLGEVLTDSEGGGRITDPSLLDLIQAYIDAREMEKEAEKIKEDVRRELASISGRTDTHVVKWVHVNPAEVPGYSRAGYSKLEIRAIPRRKRNGS